MKHGKILMGLMAILLVASLFVGCTQSSSPEDTGSATPDAAKESEDAPVVSDDSGDKVVIGVSFETLAQERWSRERDFMQEYVTENYGDSVELLIQSADGDANKQQSQCENMLAQGVDCLIVMAKDSVAAAAIVEAAHAEDVPVIAYDRNILNCDLDYFLSFDYYHVGELVGEYCVENRPTGNYFFLTGEPADQNAKLLLEGALAKIQPLIDSGDVVNVGEQWCAGWSNTEAQAYMENALTAQDDDIDVVVSTYDGLSAGAIEALSDRGLTDVLVTGNNGELGACQRIVEGTQAMTVYTPNIRLAHAGIEAAITLAKGEKPEVQGVTNNGQIDVPTIFAEVTTLTKDNINIIIDDGFHSKEDVYANVEE